RPAAELAQVRYYAPVVRATVLRPLCPPLPRHAALFQVTLLFWSSACQLFCSSSPSHGASSYLHLPSPRPSFAAMPCPTGFGGAGCSQCVDQHYGASCLPCSLPCISGTCRDGMTGDGTCACFAGWVGDVCDTQGEITRLVCARH